MFDVAIIGSGASGMCAAICAAHANPALNIALIERLDRVGRKLSSTGNGQCNIANKNLSREHYYCEDSGFVEKIFEKCGFEQIKDFFDKLGVPFIVEASGKCYPCSLQAGSVTDALRFECETLGINTLCGVTVKGVVKSGNSFVIECENNTIEAAKIILAAGGLAGGEKLGCDGLGFQIAKSFGHGVTKLYPAIVQMKTENRICRQLKGIKVNCGASLIKDGQLLRQEYGEVLFCDYGLSGPPILQLSARAQSGGEIVLDLIPDMSFTELYQTVLSRAKRFADRPLSEFFTGMLNKRLGQVIIKDCGFSLSDTAAALTNDGIEKLAARIKGFAFTVTGNCGHLKAQATLGGVRVNEFYPDTLQSKKTAGLYACGEILDVCGDCGGYNLSFAWASGIIAGTAAAE